MLTLGCRSSKATVQFLVAAPKEAMKSLIDAGKDSTASCDEEAPLNEELDWLDACSRIFLYRSGETNGVGEDLAMRELKKYLQRVDPDDAFSEVSDLICFDSVGLTLSEIREVQGNSRYAEFLQVTSCNDLTPTEMENVRRKLPEEWMTLLHKPSLVNPRCLAVSMAAALASGLALYFGYQWFVSESRAPCIAEHWMDEELTMNTTVAHNTTDTTIENTAAINSIPTDSRFLYFVSKVAENTTKRIFGTTPQYEPNTTAHYGTTSHIPNTDDSTLVDLATTVAVNVAREALQKNIVNDVGTMKDVAKNTNDVAKNTNDVAKNTNDVAKNTTSSVSGNTTKPSLVRKKRGLNLKLHMSERELAWLRTNCPGESYKVLEDHKEPVPLWMRMEEEGQYPCGGLSGQLRCQTATNKTPNVCYAFGGPWTFDAFAVRDAIRRSQQRVGDCFVRCDERDKEMEHVWTETGRHLPWIASYPEVGFIDYTFHPAKADIHDFNAMIETRYPLVEKCSGICSNCLNDPRIRRCTCDFARTMCWGVESIGYNTEMERQIKLVTLFNGNSEKENKRVKCRLECRKVRPDIPATFGTKAEVKLVETGEPPRRGDNSLDWMMSRRELSLLQRPVEECGGERLWDNRRYWIKLDKIGPHPCRGRSGLIKCERMAASSGRFSLNPEEWFPYKNTCHRFGPQHMGVYAVQDAARQYFRKVRNCFVTCDTTEQVYHTLWQMADDNLGHLPGYQSYHLPKPDSVLNHLEEDLREHHPTEKRQVSFCNRHCIIADDRVCRLAHVECVSEYKNQLPETLHSFGFTTSVRDAYKMLGIPVVDKRQDLVMRKCITECYGELWPVPDQWPLGKK
ncbi:hypothetical protein GNI_095500 [Gregarina niphandrodes]|uniref:Uncharacterized protein n=1 Tax=Gregarina niphandrodes TaxID=110365 RepID=A0A023B555_GRENI|nr:hypothetical protein GNI_095500 [Gregarina niphandrodes]EZG58141.1 hypothetical protein GNI_095500 [Gregarina niphandrodes]|eukprot:XP_011130984.1 hypothetical protein GNI_095500 [Gregarina niphandrodes]